MAHYKNFFSRFVLRKNWARRVQMRLRGEFRKIMKNEFDDVEYIFKLAGIFPKLIVDGGANIGFWTWQFRKRFPTAVIHAFEPNTLVFEKLQQSYASDAKVITHNKGLGSKRAKLRFHVNKNSGTSSFLEPTAFHKSNLARNELKQIEIDVVSIDETFASSDSDIDILKIDVEGYELNVLSGGEQMLDDSKIHVVISEYNLVPTYENQPLLQDLLSFMAEKGYTPYNLYGYHETAIRQMLLGNILFISPKLKCLIEEAVGKENCAW